MVYPKDIDKIIVQVPRAEVEGSNHQYLLEILSNLTEDMESIVRFKHSLTLGFMGFDEDPRELWEIPEVRKYIQEVTKSFPLWLYFCNYEDHSLWLILLSHCKTSKTSAHELEFDQGDGLIFLTNMFDGLNDFFKSHCLLDADSEEISRKVGQYFTSGRIPSGYS